MMHDALSRLEEDLLTLLAGRELYGLAILHACTTLPSGGMSLTIGALYPTLHRLEAQQLVRSWWEDVTLPREGHTRRRYYTVTPRGDAALRAARQRRRELAQYQEGLETPGVMQRVRQML